MTRTLTAFGDRLLERFAPKATAKADVSYEKFCYCTVSPAAVYSIYKLCHVVGGIASCNACDIKKPWCST